MVRPTPSPPSSVVVGVDASANARLAGRWAAAIAEATEARLQVVRSWEYPAATGLPTGPASLPRGDKMQAAVTREVEELIDDERLTVPHGVTASVSRGPAAQALVAASRRTGVFLLVVGSRGLGGLDGMVLGSVGRACVEHAPVPVLVVPRGAPSPSLEGGRILLGYDGSDGAQAALEWAVALATRVHASVVAVRGITTREAARPPELDADPMGTVAERLDALAIDHHAATVDTDPRTLLVDLAEERDATLVIVGQRGLGRLPHLRLGSVAHYVVQHSRRPVLVVRGPTDVTTPPFARQVGATTA
jgi:nucleotide-binding universal stress UspA family protein